MISNSDVQQILNNNENLQVELNNFKDIKPGSGETMIHLYAFKMLLEELAAYKLK